MKKKNPWLLTLKNDDFEKEEFPIYQDSCYFHDMEELKGFEDTDDFSD